MSPLQLLRGRRSFVRTLFLCLLVSLSTQSISAWIQQQRVASGHLYRSRGSCTQCPYRHEARVHQQASLEDEPSTPISAGKTWNAMPEHQGGLSSPLPLLSRRSTILNIVLLSSTTTAMSANAADDTGTAVDIDPFATLDSIASGFGSSGAPLSTTKAGTPQIPSAAAAESNRNPSPNTSNLSPLEKALEESRKRKQIDPRTHG